MCAVALLALVLPTPAWAGRKAFNRVFDNEVLPARVVEVQAQVTDTFGSPAGTDITAVWWAAAFGLSNTVEVSLPIKVTHVRIPETGAGSTFLDSYGADLRWRIAKKGTPPGFWRPVPLLRLIVEKPLATAAVNFEGDVVIGTELSKWVHSSAMIGVVSSSTAFTGEGSTKVTGGFGAVANLSGSWRAGGEVYAEVPLVPAGGVPTFTAGPDLSYTLGPFWVSAGSLFGFGDRRPYTASARLLWGAEL
ncbi:MAG: hypothetical protein EXR69_05710 [Myxococcales bacterium]|nr:hypothetical protein [Myxococcales bacterium]